MKIRKCLYWIIGLALTANLWIQFIYWLNVGMICHSYERHTWTMMKSDIPGSGIIDELMCKYDTLLQQSATYNLYFALAAIVIFAIIVISPKRIR